VEQPSHKSSSTMPALFWVKAYNCKPTTQKGMNRLA